MALLACGASGLAVYEAGEVRQTRAALANGVAQREAVRLESQHLAARVRDAEQMAQTAGEQRTTLQKQLDERDAAKERVGTAQASVAPAPSPIHPEVRMLFNPESQRLSLETERINSALWYGRLLRKLRLSSQQVAEFLDARVALAQGYVDLARVMRSQGVSSFEDPALGGVSNQTAQEAIERIRRVLGDAGYAEYQAFDTAPRFTADALAGQLYATDTPLTAEQADRLMQAVRANTGVPILDGSIQYPGATDWAAVIAQAEAVLAPSQLAVLKRTVDEERIMKAMTEIMRKPENSPDAVADRASSAGSAAPPP